MSASAALPQRHGRTGAGHGGRVGADRHRLRRSRDDQRLQNQSRGLIQLGPHHPAVRARFGARACLLFGRDLDAAIAAVERWWRDERKAFQTASALGCATRLSLEVLRELRLMLRLMRCKKMYGEFGEIVSTLWGAPIVAAAE